MSTCILSPGCCMSTCILNPGCYMSFVAGICPPITGPFIGGSAFLNAVPPSSIPALVGYSLS